MAFTDHLLKLVWGGRLFDTEQWTCSLHLISVDSPSTDSSALFQAPISAWFQASESYINKGARLDYVKANEIDPITLHYVDPGFTSEYLYVPSVGPALSAASGFGQDSLVISLATAAARGRASKGRFYPPSSQINLPDNTGAIQATVATTIAVKAVALLDGINAASTAKVCVFSHIGQTARTVTGVRVGRVMDTQRSRRSSLEEQYVTAPLTA